MTKAVKAIPEGYTSITPYIIVKNASDAIEFYKKAFDAKELHRMAGEDGKIMHAEIQIGNARLMLADEFPEMKCFGPKTSGETPVLICLYVNDVDHTFDAAVKAGATVVRPLKDQFYGDRIGWITCPFGHSWSIATRVEDLSHEEIAERAKTATCG
ncbi:MAG TPA: VOC family protein [Gammaproteobacteria bacterium]|nr:VOC family protein [Gammaproteobacteria bacterium]